MTVVSEGSEFLESRENFLGNRLLGLEPVLPVGDHAVKVADYFGNNVFGRMSCCGIMQEMGFRRGALHPAEFRPILKTSRVAAAVHVRFRRDNQGFHLDSSFLTERFGEAQVFTRVGGLFLQNDALRVRSALLHGNVGENFRFAFFPFSLCEISFRAGENTQRREISLQQVGATVRHPRVVAAQTKNQVRGFQWPRHPMVVPEDLGEGDVLRIHVFFPSKVEALNQRLLHQTRCIAGLQSDSLGTMKKEMKANGFVACLAVAGFVNFLHGAEPFVPPEFVKELKDLDAVMSDAEANNKGVTFLLMEPGST